MDRNITLYLLTIVLISSPCDSRETTSAPKSDLGDGRTSDADSADNEIPTFDHESALINQYSSPPLCYEVHYAEMAELPKIICGKELQQIYLKFNPGLMKNLFVNIYLMNEKNPITIKPIESLNSIYNATNTAAPYFEPPINPEHAERLASLEPTSQKGEEAPPPFKAIYYYPEAQKYPDNRSIHKVTIGPPGSLNQLNYERDDRMYFNRRGPQSLLDYDPYAYRSQRQRDSPIEHESKNVPDLWNKILKTNKPMVLNCLLSPLSCPSNIYPLPLSNLPTEKIENFGYQTNNYAFDPNSGAFEDYDESPNSVQEKSPYYNYNDLQKILLDPKRNSVVNSSPRSYFDPRKPSLSPQEKSYDPILPGYGSYRSNGAQVGPQSDQFFKQPSPSGYKSQNNLYQPIRNYYAPLSYSQRPVQSGTPPQNSVQRRSSYISSQPDSSLGQSKYYSNKFEYPISYSSQPQIYLTANGPVIRRYIRKPIVSPILPPQQFYNPPKKAPNFYALLGFIQPIKSLPHSADKTPNLPLTKPNVKNGPLSDPSVEDKATKNATDPLTTKTEPALANKDSPVSATESLPTVKGLALNDDGPEVPLSSDIEDPEEDHVRKKPAALASDDNLSPANLQKSISSTGIPGSNVKSFKQTEDDVGTGNILQDYIMNLKNKERQYEKVIYQSQRQIEELQHDLNQLKNGADKYSKSSTPYFNYGVNNNNTPLLPVVPIVQHFTSLSSPYVPSPANFYPGMSNPSNLQAISPFSSHPGSAGKYAKGTEYGGMNIEALNALGAYEADLVPQYGRYPYAFRTPVSNDDIIDYVIEADPKSINYNAKLQSRYIKPIVQDPIEEDETNAIDDPKTRNISEEDPNTKKSSSQGFPTQDFTMTSQSAVKSKTMTDSSSSQDDSKESSPSVKSASEDSSPINGPSSATAENFDEKLREKTIKTTKYSNVKVSEEFSSNRTIIRGDPDAEKSTQPSVSTVPTDGLSTETSDTTILTETTGTETETTTMSPTSTTNEVIVGVGADQSASKTGATASTTLSPLNNSTKNFASAESPEGGQTSGKSAESNSRNTEAKLDPLIEEIVAGMKGKRNYIDDFFENVMSNSKPSQNSDSEIKRSERSPILNESKETLARLNSPLQLSFYLGDDSSNKS